MDREILVAGGGIGGMAAALALARRGRRVKLLEKAPEFGEIGYGLQCGPNVHRMLDFLGVMPAIEPQVFYPKALVMADAVAGGEIARIDLGRGFVERYGRPYFVVHRRDLHGALWDACAKHENVSLHVSKGLATFREVGDVVQVTCEDGSQHEGAALVGCDGLRSVARAAIVRDGPPRAAGHVAYRGVVPIDAIRNKDYEDLMVLWVGHNMHLVQYRLRGGTVMNNVAVIESEAFKRGAKSYGGPDELEATFSQAVPYVRDMLGYVGRDRNWLLHDRDPVLEWTAGRVTLLGDAAHPTLQYLAQGACMAIEDAVVLAEKVGSPRDGAVDYNAAFRAYQEARALRTARVVLTSRVFGGICHAGGAARALRNEIMSRRTPETFREYDWLYRGIPTPTQ